MPAKKAANKPAKSFEESLWGTSNTAMRASAELESEGTPQSVPEGQDQLRGSVEASDWSGATETTRQACPQGERGGANQYKHVVLLLIFLKFVSSLTAVEKSNAPLKGALPDNYFSRLGLDGSKLSALIDQVFSGPYKFAATS